MYNQIIFSCLKASQKGLGVQADIPAVTSILNNPFKQHRSCSFWAAGAQVMP